MRSNSDVITEGSSGGRTVSAKEVVSRSSEK